MATAKSETIRLAEQIAHNREHEVALLQSVKTAEDYNTLSEEDGVLYDDIMDRYTDDQYPTIEDVIEGIWDDMHVQVYGILYGCKDMSTDEFFDELHRITGR